MRICGLSRGKSARVSSISGIHRQDKNFDVAAAGGIEFSPAERKLNAYTPYILFIRQIMHIMNNIIFNDLYIIIYYT